MSTPSALCSSTSVSGECEPGLLLYITYLTRHRLAQHRLQFLRRYTVRIVQVDLDDGARSGS